ncbi:MAG: SDR family NAD(P)-dependent oxidoreductase [Cyanobacteria bacterium P01_F01_bin.53]
MSTTPPPLMIVAGAGAGLGRSLLRRFQAGGYTTAGLVRTLPSNPDPADNLQQVDITNAEAATALIEDLIATHGPPKAVIHNTAELVIQPFAETTLDDFERCWKSMVQAAVILAQAVMQPMVRGGGGTFIVSGATASLRGGAKFAAFASAKFALRGLTQSLAREYHPAGVHVVHAILDGIIDTERSRQLHSLDPAKMMNPQDIAEVYWQVAHQPPSTWSHEIDLRPSSENF